MARYIDAERMPKDEFFNGLTDAEKARVIFWLLQSPTVDVVPREEIIRNMLKLRCVIYAMYSIYVDKSNEYFGEMDLYYRGRAEGMLECVEAIDTFIKQYENGGDKNEENC